MRRGSRFVALLLVSAAIAVGCSPSKKKVNEASADQQFGLTKLSKGDVTGALADLSKAHKLNPKNSEITDDLGLAYWAKAKIANDDSLRLEAEKYILQSFDQIGKDKVPPDWRNNLGALYIEMKRYGDAIVQLEKAVHDPEYRTPERANQNLAVAYFEQNQFPEALEKSDAALRFQPDFCPALITRGKVLMAHWAKSNPTAALADFLHAEQECADWQEPYLRAGEAYEQLKQGDKAREQWQKCAKLDPTSEFGRQCQNYLRM